MVPIVLLWKESVANNMIWRHSTSRGVCISVSSSSRFHKTLDQLVAKQWLPFIEDDDDFGMKKKVRFFLPMIFRFFFKIDFRFHCCDFPLAPCLPCHGSMKSIGVVIQQLIIKIYSFNGQRKWKWKLNDCLSAYRIVTKNFNWSLMQFCDYRLCF